MSRTTSPKQIAANRRNALKSTGPRTPEGRAASRLNAIRHGILSREVLVRGKTLVEDEAELETLYGRFYDDLQPEGPLEEMLVDQMVTAQWRLRRALKAEAGSIALHMDAGKRQRSRGVDPVLQWMQWTAFGDPIHAMEHSTVGCGLLRRWLREVRAAVEAEGMLSKAALEKLAARFGGKPNSLVLSLEDFCQGQQAEPAGDEATQRERQKTAALTFLDRRIASMDFMQEECDTDKEHSEQAHEDAANLPPAKVLDKIMRYEIKLERQLYRAMAQLERIQRMRRGEAIPAPLSVAVSNRE